MKHDKDVILNDGYYEVITPKGVKLVRKNPEIEAMECVTSQMTEIGKITDLFWGYNIVDNNGLIMRKFKFLSMYPDKARKMINSVYSQYDRYNKDAKDAFRRDMLNDITYSLIGFTIRPTKDSR